MTNELKNVPELRFPEFDGEWEENSLENINSFSKGKGISKKDISEEGTPCILYGELYTTYNFMVNKVKSKTLLDTKNLVRGYKNQILIPSSGETPMDIATAAVINTDDKLLLGGDINILTPKEKHDGKFITLSINGKYKRELSKFAQGKSVVHLYNNDIKKLKVKFPLNIKEQQKIGDFFSKLDRQIELEERKLAKLEEQKKGYMQKIFSQKLRFKDANGNDYSGWKPEQLNSIFTKYQNTIYLDDNEEYKRISISNKGKITHRDIALGKVIGRKRQYLIDLQKYPDTLTFIRQGVFLGGIGFVPNSLDGHIVTENMPLLSMSEKYNKRFLTYLFVSETYYKSVIVKNLPTGSAQKALHEKDWLQSFVNIPIYSEQEKIGDFFNQLDKLIEKQSDKTELLKKRKKSFLQKMFV
ncbi:restriction endonuclease subunit S [Mammaliicoccus sp. JADD-157]|uniref:restriction endonuclease subunit S n=1 Tax=Mammaliicoccus sp. JADD-157 TaxID=3404818 RepID=UPI003BB66696